VCTLLTLSLSMGAVAVRLTTPAIAPAHSVMAASDESWAAPTHTHRAAARAHTREDVCAPDRTVSSLRYIMSSLVADSA
jgi:hypothetical protein